MQSGAHRYRQAHYKRREKMESRAAFRPKRYIPLLKGGTVQSRPYGLCGAVLFLICTKILFISLDLSGILC